MAKGSFKKYVSPTLKKIGLIAVLMIIAIVIGLMIGYKVGGGNPLHVFSPKTWEHIFDFLK